MTCKNLRLSPKKIDGNIPMPPKVNDFLAGDPFRELYTKMYDSFYQMFVTWLGNLPSKCQTFAWQKNKIVPFYLHKIDYIYLYINKLKTIFLKSENRKKVRHIVTYRF